MLSLLNISLFWTNIAQAKSVGYRPRSRGGSIGTARRHLVGVSTTDQSCQRQIAELTAFAGRSGFELLGIFKETASGVELQNTGPTTAMTLATFVALCSGILGKPVQSQMVVLGSMSLGGNSVPVENLAGSLQAAFDAGAKRILLPMASVGDIPTIPGELFAKFQTSFYSDPRDAAFKSLGVE